MTLRDTQIVREMSKSAHTSGEIHQKLDTVVAIMKNILTLVTEGEVVAVDVVVFGKGHVGVDKN
jgi:hypothetical protein